MDRHMFWLLEQLEDKSYQNLDEFDSQLSVLSYATVKSDSAETQASPCASWVFSPASDVSSLRKIDVLEGFDCVCYGKAVCRCKGKGRCEQIADFFFETQANPDLALAETIPHEFEKPNKPKDVVDPHPLRYLFDDNDMSDFMFADYTDYVKYELIQEHTGIHCNLCSCPRLVFDFIENKLAEKQLPLRNCASQQVRSGE